MCKSQQVLSQGQPTARLRRVRARAATYRGEANQQRTQLVARFDVGKLVLIIVFAPILTQLQ